MAILELCVEELSHGVLAAEFAKGAVAAIIRCGGLGRSLWSQLMEDRTEQLPWEAPLVDIARNHHGSGDITRTLGDSFYFQPGQHGYIARKIEISVGSGGTLNVAPATFAQGDAQFTPASAMLQSCWSITQRLMLALTPASMPMRGYKVAVQRLKYQSQWEDFSRLMAMTEHSLGRWGRLGFALDRNRQQGAGPFAGKGPADLLAVAMMIPLLRCVALGFNAMWARRDPLIQVTPGHQTIERPHCDKRFFSGLCGHRDNVRTEVLEDRTWVELPVSMDSIALFPGDLARRHFGLKPTMHRVLHTAGEQDAAPADRRTGNVTLLIGAT